MPWPVPDPKLCSLAAGAAPVGCDWCGNLLTGRQRRWCQPFCRVSWEKNHYWEVAKKAALARDRHRCIRCGRQYGLEVNHKVPLAYSISDPKLRRAPGCQHHVAGLETLCIPCHQKVTNRQRAAGLLSPRKRKP